MTTRKNGARGEGARRLGGKLHKGRDHICDAPSWCQVTAVCPFYLSINQMCSNFLKRTKSYLLFICLVLYPENRICLWSPLFSFLRCEMVLILCTISLYMSICTFKGMPSSYTNWSDYYTLSSKSGYVDNRWKIDWKVRLIENGWLSSVGK